MRVEPQLTQLNYSPFICPLSQQGLILSLLFYEILKGLCLALRRKLAANPFAVSAIGENLHLPFPAG